MRIEVLLTLGVALLGLGSTYAWRTHPDLVMQCLYAVLETMRNVADTVGPDAARAASHAKMWLCEFVKNLYVDIKTFAELVHESGKLLNRSDAFAYEGHESWQPTSRRQDAWNFWWHAATHQDTCKRFLYYVNIRQLTGLVGWTGVAETVMELSAKACAMYVKLAKWRFLLWGMRCLACVRTWVTDRPSVDMGTWLARLCVNHGLGFVFVLVCLFVYHTNFFFRAVSVYQKIMAPGHDDVVEAWARADSKTCLSMFCGWFSLW